jgi:type I protein arginine methyltransferase
MSFRLPPGSIQPERSDSEGSSSEDEEEETWDDWVSESGDKHCQSLFDQKTFPSAAEAIAYDKSVHGFDLKSLTKDLSEIP